MDTFIGTCIYLNDIDTCFNSEPGDLTCSLRKMVFEKCKFEACGHDVSRLTIDIRAQMVK